MHHVVGVTHGGKRAPRARARPIDSLRMSRPPSPPPDAIGDLSLLEQRIASRVALIDLDGAEADAQAMLALAKRSKGAAHLARALNALSLVQNQQERHADAQRTAQHAQAAARPDASMQKHGTTSALWSWTVSPVPQVLSSELKKSGRHISQPDRKSVV